MRKPALPLGLVVAAGIAGLAAVGLDMKASGAIFIGLCLVGGTITCIRLGTDRLALAAVGFLALTVTWNGIRVGGASTSAASTVSGGAFGDATMVLAFAGVLAAVIARKRSVPMPRWLLLAGIGCALAELVTVIFPPSSAIMQRSAITEAILAQQGGGIPGQIGALGVGPDTIILVEYELALILIPVMVATVGTTVRRCRLLLDLWTIGAVINGFAGVLDLAGIPLGPSAVAQSRSTGLTIHPNYLALTCVIALPMALLWFGRSRRWNAAAVIGVASLVGGVAASGSRAGFVAAGIAVVATVAAVPRLRRVLPYILPVAAMVLVCLLLFTSLGHKLLVQARLVKSSAAQGSGSDQQRAMLASTAWSQIKVRPLSGVGWAVITGAHDIYLELLDAGGVIAFAAFLAFLGGMIASVRTALSGPLHDEAVVCGIGILAWLANGVFDNQIADKYLYLVPGLLFAMARTTWLLRSRPTQPELAAKRRLLPAPVPSGALAGISARS